MKPASIHIIRVGLGITFLWVGVLIIKDPTSWGGFLLPWAADLLLFPITQMMYATAAFDIIAGLFLLVDVGTFIFASLATLHLITVLTVVGIDLVTVRDIGLLAASLSLVFAYWPNYLRRPKSQPPDTIKKFT